ncbi:unnamed protein product, partial [Prorocentrum cordatum]
ERAALHASKFDKEFVVDLGMSDVLKEKKSVGVVLNLDTDFEPVSVKKVKKTGILEAWNRLHPDKAVMVGDEIMKVNDIMWHRNAGTFANRIKGQFLASRAQLPGARNVLTLTIQRPRKNKAIGWKLNVTVDWIPISIEKMRNTGLVARCNKVHPDAKILAGDEILQVNHIGWHHNSKIFEDRLEAQFTAARKSELAGTPGYENVLKLSIRRPRSVNDTPEEQVYTKQYSVQLALTHACPLGWHLNKSSDAEPIVVEQTGRAILLDAYNKAHPNAMVRVGDTILKLNDVLWHGNTKKFADRIDKELNISRPYRAQMPGNKAFHLVMQRRLVQPIMKEWTVTLPAGEGQILCWQLSHSEEEFPLTVSKARSNGVVCEHNQAHPDSKILPGDVIVKVNSVLWREDKGWPFSNEFYIRLPVVNGQMMGWHLSSDDETAPITVEKIRNVGVVHDWNKQNPFTDIQVGDHIAKVNSVLWHGNAEQFLERVNLQLEAARKEKGKPFVTVLVQRPWRVTTTLPENAGAGKDVVGGGDDAETGIVE